MAQLSICIGILLITATLSTNVHERCQFGIDASHQASKAVSDLALKLYQKLSKPEENLIFSPVSIALGLALVESGASGDTRSELQRYLAPPGSNQLDSSTLYESLQRQLQIKGEKTSLSIANGFFHSDTLQIKPEFINRTKQCFETRVEKALFQTDTEEARRQINQWVSDKTAQKIAELFKPRAFDASTVAVLANALHFKAPWTNKFERTENLPFYKFGRSNAAQTVPFLVQERQYAHAENEQAHLVEIPYEGAASLSFYILVPKQRDGLQALESSLTIDKMRALRSAASTKQVALKFPKFTARSSIDLKTVLQGLGVNKIFTDQADFSRMATGRLKVSKAEHEAYIKVNQNGTEAAAATGFAIMLESAISSGAAVAVTVDHPFMFAVMHKPTKATVFFGKIVKVEE